MKRKAVFLVLLTILIAMQFAGSFRDIDYVPAAYAENVKQITSVKIDVDGDGNPETDLPNGKVSIRLECPPIKTHIIEVKGIAKDKTKPVTLGLYDNEDLGLGWLGGWWTDTLLYANTTSPDPNTGEFTMRFSIKCQLEDKETDWKLWKTKYKSKQIFGSSGSGEQTTEVYIHDGDLGQYPTDGSLWEIACYEDETKAFLEIELPKIIDGLMRLFLDVPAGALPGAGLPALFSVEAAVPVPSPKNVSKGYFRITQAFNLSCNVTFVKPVTVVMYYTMSELALADERTASVFKYNSNSSRWDILPTYVNTTAKLLTFNTTELGTFGFTGSFAPDINRDGKIDILDIAAAAKAFGSILGKPKWDERADIDGNGQINVLDIAKIAKHFGKSY